MKDITLQTNLKGLQGPSGLRKTGLPNAADKVEGGPSFAENLAESLKKVNDLQKQADVAIEEFAAGKTNNIHETMLAVSKADLAFRLTMQVRNKIVEAYQEVMRMQV
ncbi:MAG: flagellar hook-basal body complex protein FliE [Nitrospinae bacterium CG11_big_fil_rev_8_21_14_0_20_56_8]|nr:MAG: flagellar hook-basal body complex protein FliE [Nitrospinae bacterium CG11_big_fil_rev_8_21_14_0_20_56_8]